MTGVSGHGPRETPVPAGDLRRRAEEKMKASRVDLKTGDAEDVRALVTELQVHQVELEIQNEELRRVQVELAQARDRYFELYDLAPVGYVTLDHRGVIRECNLTASRILGIERGRLVGRPFGSLVTPHDGDAFHLHLRKALASDASVTQELRLRRSDAPFWARLETRAARTGEAESSEYRVAFSDVTERREAEDQLKALTATLERRVAERTVELQRLAVQLSSAEEGERHRIAVLLHDGLQQDLVALRYKLETLAPVPRRGTLDEEARRELEAAIDDCVVRMRELSYDLSPPVLQNGLLPALQWLSRDVGRRYGLNVAVVARPEDEPLTPALAPVLFHLTKELLLNVRKHSGASSAEVTVSRTGEGIRVRVVDAGRGFDAAAFRKGEICALGFGLFHIEERLRFMGGDIEIQSQPGRGCRVSLSVPDRADGRAAAAIPPAGVETVSRASAVPGRDTSAVAPVLPAVVRILLADDHPLMRQGLATLLAGEKGLEVVGQAENGREAVRLASELRPDVVLIDVSMPEMDGFEATRQIKRQQPEIRVIGLSMHDDPFMAEKMKESGAEAYLCKTGSPVRLVETIRAARH